MGTVAVSTWPDAWATRTGCRAAAREEVPQGGVVHAAQVGGLHETLAGVGARVTRVHHREDVVPRRATDQPVGRLAVGGAEGALAVDDGVAVEGGLGRVCARHRRPVSTAT